MTYLPYIRLGLESSFGTFKDSVHFLETKSDQYLLVTPLVGGASELFYTGFPLGYLSSSNMYTSSGDLFLNETELRRIFDGNTKLCKTFLAALTDFVNEGFVFTRGRTIVELEVASLILTANVMEKLNPSIE